MSQVVKEISQASNPSHSEFKKNTVQIMNMEFNEEELRLHNQLTTGVLRKFKKLDNHPSETYSVEIEVIKTEFWRAGFTKSSQLLLKILVQNAKEEGEIERLSGYFELKKADSGSDHVFIFAKIQLDPTLSLISRSIVKIVPRPSMFLNNSVQSFLARRENGLDHSNLWLDAILNPATYKSHPEFIHNEIQDEFLRIVCRQIRDSHCPNQLQALNNGLKYPFSIITGPTGTGKTYVLVSIMATLKSMYSTGKCLAIARSNFVCDGMAHAVIKMLQYYFPCITPFVGLRIYSKKKEMFMRTNNKNIDFTYYVYVLHQLVDSLIDSEGDDSLKTLLKRIRNGEYVLFSSAERMQWLAGEAKFERQILGSSKYGIIICSLSTALDSRFKFRNGRSKLRVDTILVDDASSICQAHTLPLLDYGQKRVVLAYDERQTVLCHSSKLTTQSTELACYQKSIVERFSDMSETAIPNTTLNEQYRIGKIMHEIVAAVGYSGRNYTCKTNYFTEIPVHVRLALGPSRALLVYDHDGMGCEIGYSYNNIDEAKIVGRICLRLSQSQVLSEHISIITPYTAQRDLLSTFVNKRIKPMRSEAMRGLENKISVISLVYPEMDSCLIERSLTICLSRASNFVIVVLNKTAFAEANIPLYSKMLKQFEELGDNRKAAEML